MIKCFYKELFRIHQGCIAIDTRRITHGFQILGFSIACRITSRLFAYKTDIQLSKIEAFRFTNAQLLKAARSDVAV